MCEQTKNTVKQAIQYIRTRSSVTPQVGVVLGSGLGGLAHHLENSIEIPYHLIPGFQSTHAQGHRGLLVIGSLEGTPIVVMAGRYHRYEGFSNKQVTYPISVMHQLGIEQLIITNAAGGLNPKFQVGDLMVLKDHINWLNQSTHQNKVTRASSLDKLQMDHLPANLIRTLDFYPQYLIDRVHAIARAHQITVISGTYLATLGPTYETRSEYRMMRKIGADAVGMSSIPEALMAKSLGIDPITLSVVTNVANPDQRSPADHQDVLEAGKKTESNVETIVRGLIRYLRNRKSSMDA